MHQRRHRDRSGSSKQPDCVPGTFGNARGCQAHAPDSKHRPHSPSHNAVADARRRDRGADARADLPSSSHGDPSAYCYPYAGTGSYADRYAGTDADADSYRGTDRCANLDTGADANTNTYAPSHRDASSNSWTETNG